MKSDPFDDDNTTNEGGVPLRRSTHGEDDITVLACTVHVRPLSHRDGALCFTGHVAHGGYIYTFVWDNCIDSVESRLTLIRRVAEKDSILAIDDFSCWVHDFVASTVEGNMVQVGLDCMFNDMREQFSQEGNSIWHQSDLGRINVGDFCV